MVISRRRLRVIWAPSRYRATLSATELFLAARSLAGSSTPGRDVIWLNAEREPTRAASFRYCRHREHVGCCCS